MFASLGSPAASSAQDEDLQKLDGEWLFVEDRTEGRADDEGQAPMNVKFTLRVEEDGVIYPRSRGDERIALDGSVIEKQEVDGSIARYRGEWKKKDAWLEYTLERVRPPEDEPGYILKRVFRVTDEGLLVYVFSNKSSKQVALYRHPEDIDLPEPKPAEIAEVEWLAGAWAGTKHTSSIEEHWSPPKGGAMLGVSRTVKGDKMVQFEFLRIVERDTGLVYIAQPGGRTPTEFVLTNLGDRKAVFVNPRHDYPQRIVYRLSKEGTLTTSVGFAKGHLQSYTFEREDR